jgi:4-amino-4-deoxy-L-arabinose transferase-like glycosyltransferase
MRRHFFTLVSVLSLLLCLATLALWVVTFWHSCDVAKWGNPRTSQYSISAYRGDYDPSARWFHYTAHIAIDKDTGFTEISPRNDDLWKFSVHELAPGLRASDHAGPRRFGSVVMAGHHDSVVIWTGWIFFASLPLALAAIMSLLRILRSRNRRRSGDCPACGYKLTGNTSGVCPECGTTIESRDSKSDDIVSILRSPPESA